MTPTTSVHGDPCPLLPSSKHLPTADSPGQVYFAIDAVMTATGRPPSRFSSSVKNRPSMSRIPMTEKNDGSTALNPG